MWYIDIYLRITAMVVHIFSLHTLGSSTTKLINLWWKKWTQSHAFKPSVMDKSLTLKKWWEGLGLISSGVSHPIRLAFWGEGNGLVTSGIRTNLNLALMSRQALRRGVGREPHLWRGCHRIGWGRMSQTRFPHRKRDGRVKGLKAMTLHTH